MASCVPYIWKILTITEPVKIKPRHQYLEYVNVLRKIAGIVS